MKFTYTSFNASLGLIQKMKMKGYEFKKEKKLNLVSINNIIQNHKSFDCVSMENLTKKYIEEKGEINAKLYTILEKIKKMERDQTSES